MKAFGIRKYNAQVEQLDLPNPQLGPNDVLVKVAAASLNQLDEMLRVGTFKANLPYKMPLVLGNDFAGTVQEIGIGVTKFKVGDLVFGKPNQARIGTFAQFVAVDQGDIALAPKTTSPAQAASLPLVALTAWQALVVRGNLQPGQKVLIHGGTGGVGSVAIQLAKSLGATVATTASSAKAEFVKELGADVIVDYKTQDFATLLSDYDLVLDTQGGTTLFKSLGVLRRGGKVIGIAGPPDVAYAKSANLNPVLQLVMSLMSAKVNKAAKAFGVSYEFLFVQANGQQLAKLAQLVDAGTIRPIVSTEFEFDQTPQALAEMSAGQIKRGKAVVNISD